MVGEAAEGAGTTWLARPEVAAGEGCCLRAPAAWWWWVLSPSWKSQVSSLERPAAKRPAPEARGDATDPDPDPLVLPLLLLPLLLPPGKAQDGEDGASFSFLLPLPGKAHRGGEENEAGAAAEAGLDAAADEAGGVAAAEASTWAGADAPKSVSCRIICTVSGVWNGQFG